MRWRPMSLLLRERPEGASGGFAGEMRHSSGGADRAVFHGAPVAKIRRLGRMRSTIAILFGNARIAGQAPERQGFSLSPHILSRSFAILWDKPVAIAPFAPAISIRLFHFSCDWGGLSTS